MNEGAIIVVAALVVAWSSLSRPLERWGLSAPMVFLVAGFLLGNGHVRGIELNIDTGTIRFIAELTLALVLFSDASGIDPDRLRRDPAWPARLLLIGLPISLGLGTVVAVLVLAQTSWTLAALAAAVLAATDASLSATVITDTRVPERARRALNVESGLNDGMATPVVVLLIAAAAIALGVPAAHGGSHDLLSVVGAVLGGALAGLGLGVLGALVVTVAHRRSWSALGGGRVAVLALAVLIYVLTEALGGNGFVASFVGGLAFRLRIPRGSPELVELPEFVGTVLAWITWFVFGALLVVPAFDGADWRVLLYAVASLTIVRMTAVALAMVRSDADRDTRLLLGWFGPRGLASVVFALLIAETLPSRDPAVHVTLGAIAATVVLSVVAHAFSANPVINRLTRR